MDTIYILSILLENWVLVMFVVLTTWIFIAAWSYMRTLLKKLIDDVDETYSNVCNLAENSLDSDESTFIKTLSSLEVRERVGDKLFELIAIINSSYCFGHYGNSIESNCSRYVGKSERFISTDQINLIFQFDTLEHDRIPCRDFNQAQQSMISLGVLGTFVGLVIGITSAATGLASTDPNEARHALGELLDGAGIAFTTSLLGLLFSLLFSISRTKLETQLESKVNRLRRGLQAILPFEDQSVGISSYITRRIPLLIEEIIKKQGSEVTRIPSLKEEQMAELQNCLLVLSTNSEKLENIRRSCVSQEKLLDIIAGHTLMIHTNLNKQINQKDNNE